MLYKRFKILKKKVVKNEAGKMIKIEKGKLIKNENYNLEYSDYKFPFGTHAGKFTQRVSLAGAGVMKPNLRVASGILKVATCTPFPMGTFNYLEKKDQLLKFDPTGLCLTHPLHAEHQIMLSTEGVAGYGENIKVKVKRGEKGEKEEEVLLNMDAIRLLVTQREIEFDFIFNALYRKNLCIEQNQKIPIGIAQAKETTFEGRKMEQDDYNNMRAEDRWEIDTEIAMRFLRNKSIYSTPTGALDPTFAATSAAKWSMSIVDLSKEIYFFSMSRKCYRFKGEKEKPSKIFSSSELLTAIYKGQHYLCEITDKKTQKKSVVGRYFDPPVIYNSNKEEWPIFGVIDQNKNHIPLEIHSGDLVNVTYSWDFMPYGFKSCHPSLGWESAIIFVRGAASSNNPRTDIFRMLADFSAEDRLKEGIASQTLEIDKTLTLLLKNGDAAASTDTTNTDTTMTTTTQNKQPIIEICNYIYCVF